MTDPKQPNFDAEVFLASAGLGRSIVRLKARDAFFSQGSEADSIFYLQKGRAKLTVVSAAGKEATLAFLTAGDFIGEESLAGVFVCFSWQPQNSRCRMVSQVCCCPFLQRMS